MLRDVRTASATEGKTIVFVSHDLDAIRDLCDRVLLLEKGSITAIGETMSVLESYDEHVHSAS